MIVFNDDGTVTMPREKFDDIAIKASKNWSAEMAVLHAYMIFNSWAFTEEQIAIAREEFIHGTQKFIQDLQALTVIGGT